MIVIGYSADRYGKSALDHGIAEATVRGTDLVVINSSKGDALSDPTFALHDRMQDLEQRLSTSGLAYELTQPVGVDVVDALLAVMEQDNAELLVIGIRHRTPVGKLLLGSNSQQLILRCPKAGAGGQACGGVRRFPQVTACLAQWTAVRPSPVTHRAAVTTTTLMHAVRSALSRRTASTLRLTAKPGPQAVWAAELHRDHRFHPIVMRPHSKGSASGCQDQAHAARQDPQSPVPRRCRGLSHPS